MKLTEINSLKELIDLMVKHGISELEIKTWRSSVRIVRSNPIKADTPIQAPLEVKKENLGSELLEIKSPMVGTFYRGPSLEAEGYVKEGDHITSDTTVCVIEAMNLMNEIKAKISGTIQEVLVQNKNPVDYGMPLFKVKPD